MGYIHTRAVKYLHPTDCSGPVVKEYNPENKATGMV